MASITKTEPDISAAPLRTPASGIRDNYTGGSVAEFLRDKIRDGSELSVVSAFFTIYAWDAFQYELSKIDHMRFLFGEPRFIQRLDPDRTDKKSFKIEERRSSALESAGTETCCPRMRAMDFADAA
jgi:hypothetical protein